MKNKAFIFDIDGTLADCIVKKEMYEAIKGKFDIVGVFEDRKQVKQMWVEEGLFVFDVNQYDLIF